MYTVRETVYFQRLVGTVWNEDERNEFIDWISQNPLTGDVIPAASGLRKVRWSRKGIGKRGGARVIYFNLLDNGEIVLLMVYIKAKLDNIRPEFLMQLKEQLDA
nr:transcriptional regulator [uncultured Albidiferax sp.]